MKKLYITRHAKTEYSHDIEDRERKLLKRSKKDCYNLAKYLQEQNSIPEIIICSSSFRTIDTAKYLLEGLQKNIQIISTDDLYLAECHRILQVIQDIDDQYESVMIIAHNPGLYNFYQFFTQDKPILDNPYPSSFPPASIAYFLFPEIDQWSKIAPEYSKLKWLFTI